MGNKILIKIKEKEKCWYLNGNWIKGLIDRKILKIEKINWITWKSNY